MRWIPDIFAFLGHSASFTFKNYSKRYKKSRSLGKVECHQGEGWVRIMGQFLASINLTFFSYQAWIRCPKRNLNIPSVYCVFERYTWDQTTSLNHGVRLQMVRCQRLLKFQQLNLCRCSTQKAKTIFYSYTSHGVRCDEVAILSSNIGQSETDIKFQQSTMFAMNSIKGSTKLWIGYNEPNS